MDFLIDPYRFKLPAVGCNIGYATNYLDYAQDPNTGIFSGSGVQPTSAQILASNSYAKRTTFLTEVMSRGMIYAEADFETQPTVSPGSTTPIVCTASGGFTQNFTVSSRRYTDISAVSHSASSVAVISGPSAGRFNVMPTTAIVPAARWLEFGGNCARIVLTEPVIGVGFFIVDAADDFGGGVTYSPYTLVLTTSAGEVSYTPVNPSSSFGFFAAIMATGVTISAFEVRWSDFGGDPDDTDYLGIDGLILARCPSAAEASIFFDHHNSIQEGTSIPPTQAQVGASLVYAKHLEFIAHLGTLGMQTAVADFESQSATSNSTAPLNINATGGFSMTITAQGRWYAGPETTASITARSTRINGSAVAGRVNLVPPNGTKHMQSSGNACLWTFPSPISAFGINVIDLGDNADAGNFNNNPFTFYVTTSAGVTIHKIVDSPPIRFRPHPPGPPLFWQGTDSMNQDDFWFWGIVLPVGVTMTSVLLRWQDFNPTPSLEDILGADGIVLGRY